MDIDIKKKIAEIIHNLYYIESRLFYDDPIMINVDNAISELVKIVPDYEEVK